jgi:four helix bundle protein
VKDEKPKLEDLRSRTKRFALCIIQLFTELPKNEVARVLGRQMLRSGTSVGAHYRESCRARSDAEFVSKLQGGMQELDETLYWLELLLDSGQCPPEAVTHLILEADQIMAILVTIVRKRKADA